MADELLPHLDPRPARPNQADRSYTQVRVVPLQPSGVPITHIYLGPEIGMLPWASRRPNPGETVAIVGVPGSQVVLSPPQHPMRDPLFSDLCRCRCPASSTGGLIFYLTEVQDTTILLGVDGETGDVVFYSTLPEVISGAGIAVDPEEPHDLYILDDRGSTQNLNVDGALNPDPTKQWYFMLRYVLSDGSYTFGSIELMPGYAAQNPFTNGANSLSVHDGVCWICLASEPATIRKWGGSGFTDLLLTVSDAPYVARLLGPVVRVTTKPAPRASYFVLALVGDTTYELVQFNGDGSVQQRMTDSEMTHPQALLAFCNRLTIFQGSGTARTDPGTFQEGEGGGEGGGDEGGGGEEA